MSGCCDGYKAASSAGKLKLSVVGRRWMVHPHTRVGAQVSEKSVKNIAVMAWCCVCDYSLYVPACGCGVVVGCDVLVGCLIW